MRKIISVKVEGHTVICTLENGERYRYDMNFVNTEGHEMTQELRDQSFFERVFIEYGSLAWPNGYDIHVNTVISDGEKLEKAS